MWNNTVQSCTETVLFFVICVTCTAVPVRVVHYVKWNIRIVLFFVLHVKWDSRIVLFFVLHMKWDSRIVLFFVLHVKWDSRIVLFFVLHVKWDSRIVLFFVLHMKWDSRLLQRDIPVLCVSCTAAPMRGTWCKASVTDTERSAGRTTPCPTLGTGSRDFAQERSL